MKDLNIFLKDNLISESFSSSIFQEINKRLEADKEEERKKNEEIRKKYEAENEERAKKGLSKLNVNSYLNTDYKRASLHIILDDLHIAWDKLTDDCLDEYSFNEIDKVIKLGKQMSSDRNTSFLGFILPVFKGGNHKYRHILISYMSGNLLYYSFANGYGKRYGRGSNLKPKDVEDYIKPGWQEEIEKYYVLNLDKHPELKVDTKRQERFKSLENVIYNTKKYYERLADDNRERYRKAAEQLRMKKYADDGINELVKDYNERCLSYVDKFVLDPIKFAKCEYPLKTLITLSSNVLREYANYAACKLSMGSGHSYNWEADNLEKAKNEMRKMCKQIDKQIDEIENRLAKI